MDISRHAWPGQANGQATILTIRAMCAAIRQHSGSSEWHGARVGEFQYIEAMLSHCVQPPDSMLGAVDGMVLERLAKIMSYMRPSERGKNSKKLRKKDKLAMLNGQPLEERANGSYANGHASGGDDDAGPAPGPPPKVSTLHEHAASNSCISHVHHLPCCTPLGMHLLRMMSWLLLLGPHPRLAAG